jgi:hypothetical protein
MKYSSSGNVTAIAAAVAISLGSGAVMAATTTLANTDLRYISTEKAAVDAAASSVAVYDSPAFTVTTGTTAYANGDRVTVSISGGTLRATDIGSVTCGTVGAGQNGFTLTPDLTRSSGNTVVMTVGDVVGAATSRPCDFPAGKFKILASSLTSSTVVRVDFSATAANGTSPYDTITSITGAQAGNATLALMLSRPQFSITTNGTTSSAGASAAAQVRNPITNLIQDASGIAISAATSNVPFNNIIGSSSVIFGGVGTTNPASENASTAVTGYSDVLRIVLRNEEATNGLAATYNSTGGIISSVGETYVITVTGDWSFLDDDSNGCSETDLGAGANTLTQDGAASIALDSTCGFVTVVYNTGANQAALVLDRPIELRVRLAGYDPTVGAATVGQRTGRAISARTFSATADWRATATASTNRSRLTPAAGSWTNATVGSSSAVRIPYLPYGSGISRIVYVTSSNSAASTVAASSRVNGTLSFQGYYNGTECVSTNFASVAIPASGVVNVGGVIDAGLRACFPTIDSDSGKAQVLITATNSSSAVGLNTTGPSIEVTSAYNVSGNRNVVINSSNEQ